MECFLSQHLEKGLKTALRRGKNGFEYVDDLSYLETFYKRFGDYNLLLSDFVNGFSAHYTSVRMYHCCRPIDTSSYYEEGIRALNYSRSDELFRTYFLGNPEFPKVQEEHIKAAICHMANSYKRESYVYFGVDDRFLIRHCGHYLIYGSEYIQVLATFIQQQLGYDTKPCLKRFGKPTIFEVDIPVEFFSQDELSELARNALYTWAYNVAREKKGSPMIDFAIEIQGNLPPELISGHYHPEEIPDPLRQYVVYRYRAMQT